jgi:hypothetical protein
LKDVVAEADKISDLKLISDKTKIIDMIESGHIFPRKAKNVLGEPNVYYPNLEQASVNLSC